MRKQVQTSNERGVVSLLVTLVFMVVITLIVLGFAKIVRREQRQALDRQLSTQAFYAAESGVNDAIKVLQANSNAAKPNCDNIGADPSYATVLGPNSNQLDGTSVQYTCVLVNLTPNTLEYSNIGTDAATSVPINASASISSLSIGWQDTDGGNSFSGCPATLGSFPPTTGSPSWPTSNCDAGVLRVDIVPIGADLSRSNLLNTNSTIFLYPGTTGTNNDSLANLTASKGQIKPGKCGASGAPTSRPCNFTIGLSGSNYFLRLRSIYRPNAVTISATTSSGQVSLSNAQAAIDSTGKANDVLRRIGVRVNLNPAGDGSPSFSLQSRDSLCKRFSYTSTPLAVNADPIDPACQLN